MVKVGGEKMSKSLGNFTTIRDLLEKVDSMAVRLFVLQGHYRKHDRVRFLSAYKFYLTYCDIKG